MQTFPSFITFFAFLIFASLAQSQRYDVTEETQLLVERRLAQLRTVADVCVAEQGGTSLGEPFLLCVLAALEEKEKQHKAARATRERTSGTGDSESDDEIVEDYFPVPRYTLSPLTVSEGHGDGSLLLDLLRNYTCSRDSDGGSPVQRNETWVYDEAAILAFNLDSMTCPSDLSETEYLEAVGYLPAGDDLTSRSGVHEMKVEDAFQECDDMPLCNGFTYILPSGEGELPHIFFKGNADIDKVGYNEEWKSYIRKKVPKACKAAAESWTAKTKDDSSHGKENAEDSEVAEDSFDISDGDDTSAVERLLRLDLDFEINPPREYRVEILRDEPLVAIIPDFATVEEVSNPHLPPPPPSFVVALLSHQ